MDPSKGSTKCPPGVYKCQSAGSAGLTVGVWGVLLGFTAGWCASGIRGVVSPGAGAYKPNTYEFREPAIPVILRLLGTELVNLKLVILTYNQSDKTQEIVHPNKIPNLSSPKSERIPIRKLWQ